MRDLRRLLELYQRWQVRLFNHHDFNKFEAALEKMSGTNALKVEWLLRVCHSAMYVGLLDVRAFLDAV